MEAIQRNACFQIRGKSIIKLSTLRSNHATQHTSIKIFKDVHMCWQTAQLTAAVMTRTSPAWLRLAKNSNMG